MKKSIKTGHLLTWFAFVSFPAVLLVFDFTPLTRGYIYSEVFSKGTLQLSGKTVYMKKSVEQFSTLNIRSQFIDSVILVPTKHPFVEIIGDSGYLNNIKVEMEPSNPSLHIFSKKFFKKRALGNQTDNQLPSVNIKIGYQSLNRIVIYTGIKHFHQKGVLKGHRVHIDIEADEADLTVDANYLNLNLLKPGKAIQFDTINSSRYNQYIQQINQGKLHSIKGKADLVEIRNNNGCDHIYLDLSQLQSRQVHAKMETSDYNKLIVNPSQLFSYITPQSGRFFFKNDLICKSKAKVIHGYRTSEGIIRAQ